MSALSLDASLRTCKVETGEAQRILSDRFLNPHNMVCIPWNGYNNKGQKVCADSWYTKTGGCNSAEDRVSVENHLRPDYSSYINLNTAGIQGDIYGNGANAMSWSESGEANKYANSRNMYTGQYGNQWQSTNIGTCAINSYEKAMAQEAQLNRMRSMANNSYFSNSKRNAAGY